MEVFYFGEHSHRLFGALSRPKGSAHTGLVFCPPFGEEMVCTYARFARWAKELADQAFTVLRYHPPGAGESDGSSAEFTLSNTVESAALAAHWLRDHVQPKQIGLFGLRFGSSVAVLASPAVQPDFLVLWSPIVNLQHYFRDLLRLCLTKELVHQKASRVKLTVRNMIDQLEAGRNIDFLGYEVSPEFYRQMDARTAWPEEPPAPKVLWVARFSEQVRAVPIVEAWRKRGCEVELQILDERVFWEDFSTALPHQFMAATFQWMTPGIREQAGVR